VVVSGYGKPFTGRMIGCMWIEYGLESHFKRLRAKGMLTLDGWRSGSISQPSN